MTSWKICQLLLYRSYIVLCIFIHGWEFSKKSFAIPGVQIKVYLQGEILHYSNLARFGAFTPPPLFFSRKK